MTKRDHALAVIRYEYTTHGHETRESMRAYVENRISAKAYFKAIEEGLRIYQQKHC